MRGSSVALLIGGLLLPILPAQGSPPDEKDRVTIHGGSGDLSGRADGVTLYFNPKEIAIDKPVPWQKHQAVEGDAPSEEFTQPMRMSCRLMFDMYEVERSPAQVLGELSKLVNNPVPIPVTWGGRLWTSILLAVKPEPTQPDDRRFAMTTLWGPFTATEPHQEYPFTVDIPGFAEAATAIRRISIDPVDLPVPAGTDLPRARFTIASRKGIPPDLLKWQQAWDGGAQLRRPVTVAVFNGASPARTVTLNAGGPILLTIDDPSAKVPYVTLDVTFDGMKAGSPDEGNSLWPPDRQTPFGAYYFEVEIAGTVFPFKSCSGLKIEQAVTEVEEGGIVGPDPRLAGDAKWPRLVLGSDLVTRLAAFLDWVNAAAVGQAVRAPVRITPVFIIDGKPRPGRSLWLEEAVPVRYAFPELSAIWSEGDKMEQTVLPPLVGVVK